MAPNVNKVNPADVAKSGSIIIYKDNPPGNNTPGNNIPDNIFSIPKPKLDGLSQDAAAEAIRQYNNSVNNAYYGQRVSIYDGYIKQTGLSPFRENYLQKTDTRYDYTNNNEGENSPVAQVYSLTTGATYKDETKVKESKNYRSQEDNHYLLQSRYYGQHAIQGNNVPIGNTFIAFLTNDNLDTTATIKNTTVEKLADNFFQSADTIQKSETPNVTRQQSADGDMILFSNINNPKQQKFIKSLDATIINNDGVLSPDEIDVTKQAYVFDAETITAAKKLNKVSGEAEQRLSSAATVNMDNDDPYDAFFRKVAAMGDGTNVTKENLIKAIDAISDKGDIDPATGNMTLKFSREKLDKFLGIKRNNNTNSESIASK